MLPVAGESPIKLHKSSSGLQPLINLLSRQFFIPRVNGWVLFNLKVNYIIMFYIKFIIPIKYIFFSKHTV